jgi:hypothetical protein
MLIEEALALGWKQDSTIEEFETAHIYMQSLKIAKVPESLLAEYVVTGSPVTSIGFSGLDINTHKSYRIELEIINPTASGAGVSMFINGDTTSTGYNQVTTYNSGSTVASQATNNALIAGLSASTTHLTKALLSLVGGFAHYIADTSRGRGASMLNYSLVGAKTNTVSNITELTFTASVTNSIGIGSKVRIYRGDA